MHENGKIKEFCGLRTRCDTRAPPCNIWQFSLNGHAEPGSQRPLVHNSGLGASQTAVQLLLLKDCKANDIWSHRALTKGKHYGKIGMDCLLRESLGRVANAGRLKTISVGL